MQRLLTISALALAMLCTLGVAEAQINPKTGQQQELNGPGPQPLIQGPGMFCSTVGVPIPDNTPAGVNSVINVGPSFVLTDLDVSLTVTHTWVGDLLFTLTGPGCGPLAIADRAGVPASTFGCSGNDISAIIDDEAATSYEDECDAGTPTISGTFIGGDPPNPTLLAACDGTNISGNWTLNASDNAGGDTGSLDQWCLVTTPVPVELTEFAID